MAIKLLIAVACTITGAEVATHADVGDTVEVEKDEAAQLTRMGRAFYVDKNNDPTKGGLTATKEDADRIRREAKAIAAEGERRAMATQDVTPAALLARIAALEAGKATVPA